MRWLWPLLACAARVEALATRRGALQQIAVATQTQYLGVATSQTQGRGPRPQTAVAGPVAALPPLVVVLGAGGRTGRAIVEACVERGLRVKAATRGISAASQAFKFQGDLVSPTQCDVASRPALDAAVSGASLVVFAATASAFGDPKAVDEFGVRNAAEACIAASVKRFLLVSGAGVTHNESQAYAFLDRFGGRMGAKVRGEESVRQTFAAAPDTCTYTILRPSGLNSKPARGPSGLEVLQGDDFAGELSREDLGELCVSAGLSGACANVTFEVLDVGTGVATATLTIAEILENDRLAALANFVSGANPKPRPEPGGLRGGDFETLFAGLVPDGRRYLL